MRGADVCPPLYVPTRSECNAAKEQARETMLAAGLSPLKWQLDAMGCSCGSHIEDLPDTDTPGEAA
ncbi:hypothetical protein [Arthrobacter sp. Soil762]|uniref:hypothetical protein n=1 Tax=Arthrobacter sp. Soil762 TaxID=1736401 RepID=UPI0006F77437|nr:hypothetical protein [Arthrobacter sp. Soil762]KRE72613.1 hypothetical protein ASG77_08045 [Arthrobacter sp. Soil762]